MPRYAALIAELIGELQHKAASLSSTDHEREAIRSIALDCLRLSDRIANYVTKDILDELHGNAPMPEHGFTGEPRQPTKVVYTVDDLL